MSLAPKLELRQGQQLVMTPQLQQAIRLLQLSNVELCGFVQAELERNPLLEAVEEAAAPEARKASRAEGGEGDDAEGDWSALEPAADRDGEPVAAREGVPFAAEPGVGGWSGLLPRARVADGEAPNTEEFVAAGRSLTDELTEQMQRALTDPVERIIGAHLVHMLDDAGYLRGDLDDLAIKLGASHALIVKVLRALQGLEPAGVFARDLAECLSLQLKERNRYDPQIARLLENLNLLASHDLVGLRRAVGVAAKELAEMIGEIKQLNPKPGLKLGSIQIQPILPDVLVRAARDGSWLVELNHATLPRVLVDRAYYARVSKSARSEKERGYLVECLQNATWLVKSLDQRARTILRVAEEIVRQQDGFLTHGVEHLKPLNLKTVAEAISMHESTVSRVTTNKYMETPRGLFELK